MVTKKGHEAASFYLSYHRNESSMGLQHTLPHTSLAILEREYWIHPPAALVCDIPLRNCFWLDRSRMAPISSVLLHIWYISGNFYHNPKRFLLEKKAVRDQHHQSRASSSPRINRSLASSLLQFYDYPHPLKPGKVIKGYDKPHAFRTAQMCVTVANELGHPQSRIRQYQIACLLHDLGRAGLDQQLFGKIWSWAKQHHIPTRPREWRALHPETPYGHETTAFLQRYKSDLVQQGIPLDHWTKEQIEMRLGFARRLRKQLQRYKDKAQIHH